MDFRKLTMKINPSEQPSNVNPRKRPMAYQTVLGSIRVDEIVTTNDTNTIFGTIN